MQEQALRKGFFAESAALLYADVCMALTEESAVAKGWAKASYQEVGTMTVMQIFRVVERGMAKGYKMNSCLFKHTYTLSLSTTPCT